MGRPDAATRAAIARRRADAVDLRIAGVDPLKVALKLAADPTINADGLAYPHGYGIERYRTGRPPPSDRRLIGYVNADVATALGERRSEADVNTDHLRALMAERLERLFFVAYRSAIRTGDLPAIDRALRVIAQASKLLGLDMPTRTEITGADGGPVQIEQTSLAELEDLIAVVSGVYPHRGEESRVEGD